MQELLGAIMAECNEITSKIAKAILMVNIRELYRFRRAICTGNILFSSITALLLLKE